MPLDSKLSPDQLVKFQAEWNDHPGLRSLGAHLDLSSDGIVRAVIDPILPQHRGRLGTDAVNGAVMAGLFDLVIGLTGYMHAIGQRAGVAQLNIQFMRPVTGNRLEVRGQTTRSGRSLIFASAELRDEQDVVCGRCDGIVAIARGEPIGRLSIPSL